MNTPVRVLVVDDQPVFRRAVRAVVSQVAGFDVVGEAESGEDGVAMASALDAQVVLMDFRLRGIDGVEATRQIIAAQPSTVVILVSTTPASELPPRVETCGATAFIPKADLTAPGLEVVCRHALGN